MRLRDDSSMKCTVLQAISLRGWPFYACPGTGPCSIMVMVMLILMLVLVLVLMLMHILMQAAADGIELDK